MLRHQPQDSMIYILVADQETEEALYLLLLWVTCQLYLSLLHWTKDQAFLDYLHRAGNFLSTRVVALLSAEFRLFSPKVAAYPCPFPHRSLVKVCLLISNWCGSVSPLLLSKLEIALNERFLTESRDLIHFWFNKQSQWLQLSCSIRFCSSYVFGLLPGL